MTAPTLTPSQTVGPFFHPAMLREDAPGNVLVRSETVGTRIRVEGYVRDGDGAPVSDALVEIWQANSAGRYRHPSDRRPLPLDSAFAGFGRCGTDEAGRYWFETVKPGPVPLEGETDQAPHIVVTIFARGLTNHAITRLYFADEAANDADPILRRVPAERLSTLLARRAKTDGQAVYRFDIVLQGRGETVFFNL